MDIYIDIWHQSYKNVYLINSRTKIDSEFFTIFSKQNAKIENFLSFSNSAAKFLPFRVATQFPNLINFVFRRSKVQTIFRNSFEGLKKLEKINLTLNKIEIIEENSFDDLINLKKLWLFGNRIKNLPENLFENLNSLEELDLKENQIENLSENFFTNLKSLKVLWVGRNQMRNFTGNISLLNFDVK